MRFLVEVGSAFRERFALPAPSGSGVADPARAAPEVPASGVRFPAARLQSERSKGRKETRGRIWLSSGQKEACQGSDYSSLVRRADSLTRSSNESSSGLRSRSR